MPTTDGAGVKLKRLLGARLNQLNPFLLLDEFENKKPEDYVVLAFPTFTIVVLRRRPI